MSHTPLIQDRLYLDQNMPQAEALAVANGIAAVYSARCPSRDTANEDAAAVILFDRSAAVLIVADGLGGSAAGELAAKLAVESMQAAIDVARGTDTMLRTAIINGFEQANAAIQALGIGAATTLAVVEVSEMTIRPYHVGDSAILVTGNRGRIKLQTVAHSPVGYGLESGMLDESQALEHEDRHIVSNVIGAADMRIDIGPTRDLGRRDTVLLGSDGLFDNLSTDEIVECIRKGPLSVAARSLSETVSRRMAGEDAGQPSKLDDATFILFRAD